MGVEEKNNEDASISMLLTPIPVAAAETVDSKREEIKAKGDRGAKVTQGLPSMRYATHAVSPCLAPVKGDAEYASCFGAGPHRRRAGREVWIALRSGKRSVQNAQARGRIRSDTSFRLRRKNEKVYTKHYSIPLVRSPG